MTLITNTAALAKICDDLAKCDFVCIDTEFIREKTFWPQLCLVQLGDPDGRAHAVDPLAADIDLTPLFELLQDPSVVKVFHAGRQDIEIFVHLTGKVPEPVFDTQISAMVCGFGEAASYATLCRKLAKATVDKSSRFTDWAHRPLTDRQLRYALADVEHLSVIYRKLNQRLAKSGRADWVREDMAVLIDPATYDTDPDRAWQRIKTRRTDSKFLSVLKAVAAVRERWAQDRDMPRQRLIRDDALIEIATHEPDSVQALARTRNVTTGTAKGSFGAALLAGVKHGLAAPDDQHPKRAAVPTGPETPKPVVELLKVLLKLRSTEHDVAQKLIAGTDELERLAGGSPDLAALKGWRREIFGADALDLINGKIALVAEGGQIVTRPVPPSSSQPADYAA